MNRKEIKDEYKQMKFPMGVFQVRNLTNNMVFVDSSVDMVSKWNRHKMELEFGSHRNGRLQNDWDQSGAENFIFEVLSELKSNDEENANYSRELKALQMMVVEELKIDPSGQY